MIPLYYDNPTAFLADVRASASAYRLDRQHGQLVYIEVFVEAAGAVEQAFRTTAPYSVPVYSGSGFNSITALREIVVRTERRKAPTVILIAGDYDAAGRDIRQRAADDVAAFIQDGHHGVTVDVQTIALTEPQINEFGLIRQQLDAEKLKKTAGRGWPHDWTVELEAMAPDVLAQIIVDAIESRTDAEIRQAVLSLDRDQ